MLMNYSVMPELDSEILEQIETAGEAASNDSSNIYLFVFLCICLLIISYLLYFKYELVYEITESCKSYSSSDCSYLYRISCKIGGVTSFILVLLLIISYTFDINLFSFFGLD